MFKKLLALILCVASIFTIVSCSAGNNNGKNDVPVTPPAEEEEPELKDPIVLAEGYELDTNRKLASNAEGKAGIGVMANIAICLYFPDDVGTGENKNPVSAIRNTSMIIKETSTRCTAPEALEYLFNNMDIVKLKNGESVLSIKRFYYEFSGHIFTIHTYYKGVDGVVFSFMAPNKRSYYANGNWTGFYQLFKQAIDALAPAIEEALGDQTCDYNNDGVIDNITFLVSGEGTEYPFYVAYRSWYSGSEALIQGKKLVDYNVVMIGNGYNLGPGTALGTRHELTHSLGFPDFYGVNPDGKAPIWPFDDRYFTVYTKQTYTNWLHKGAVVAITNEDLADPNKEYVLNSCDNTEDVIAYTLTFEGRERETFWIEFQSTKSILNEYGGVPAESGLLVYRSDARRYGSGNVGGGSAHEIFAFRAYSKNNNGSEILDARHVLTPGEVLGTENLDVNASDNTYQIISYKNYVNSNGGRNTGIVIYDVVVDDENGIAKFKIKVADPEAVLVKEATRLTEADTSGNFDTVYKIEELDDNLVISESGNYLITGTGSTTSNKVVVNSGVEANITLRNVSISVQHGHAVTSNDGLTAVGAMIFDKGSKVVLTVEGNNEIAGCGYDDPGIWVVGDATNPADLTITGTGTINVSATGNAAALGSPCDKPYGNITIEGNVTLTADAIGAGGAGIGCGNSYDNGAIFGTITINGGNVKALSGSAGDHPNDKLTIPSIGGGRQLSSKAAAALKGTIIITAGNVIIESNNTSTAAARMATTPVNAFGDNVYLTKVDTGKKMSKATVKVDNAAEVTYTSHADGCVYLYLTAGTHTVTVNGTAQTVTAG